MHEGMSAYTATYKVLEEITGAVVAISAVLDHATQATEDLAPSLALARACGGFGAHVERTEDFAKAFDEAVASGLPAIIELTISPEALTPAASLSETRAKALAAQK